MNVSITHFLEIHRSSYYFDDSGFVVQDRHKLEHYMNCIQIMAKWKLEDEMNQK